MRSFIAICAALWLAGCASVADAGRLAEVEIVTTATGWKPQTWRHDVRIYSSVTAGEPYSSRCSRWTG